MEPECKSALEILIFYFFGSSRNTKKSSEEATEIMSNIAAVNMVHKGETCKSLQDCLTPFHNSTVDSVLLQKGKNLLKILICSIGGGRTKSDTDSYDNET